MQILVIPDIHNKTERVDQILARHQDVDKVVFLGDYWDDFEDTVDDANKVAQWITATAAKLGDKAVWLLGNHDAPYVFPKGSAATLLRYCPGWTPAKVDGANRYLEFRGFRIVANLGGVVFTHGGISDWNRFGRIIHDEEDILAALRTGIVFNARIEDYFSLGAVRSRTSPYPGGPLWSDFSETESEFHRHPINQIVGHTPFPSPRLVEKDGKVLIGLDTHLNHYGILMPGEGFKAIKVGADV